MLVPPGRAKAFPAVASTGNFPVPVHVVPWKGSVAQHWEAHPKGSRAPQAVLDGQTLFVPVPGRQSIGLVPEKRDLPPPEVLRGGQEVALSAWSGSGGGDGSQVGLDDLRGFSHPDDSVITPNLDKLLEGLGLRRLPT